jgi:membrane-bound lytic murein transglycosylase D
LASLNPELRAKATPKRAYQLRVPFGHEETVVRKIASVPEWTPPKSRYVTHRVRSGEALSVIARRYGTSVRAIMRANNLRSAHRIRAGQRLRIPLGRSYASRRGGRSYELVDGVYSVRRGDSLHVIASRFRTSVAKLKAENKLSSNVIQPGQKLRVRPPAPKGKGGNYRVASGDTLGNIAAAHGVSLRALLEANGLSRRSTIYPGQRLVIPK